jgi:hypothetical protein
MRASGGLLVFAILLAGITADRAILSSARAEESCLATPNGPPPPDSQWLYRTDHLKQRKCWHLVARGGVGRARVIVTQPAVLGSTLDPDRPTNRQLEPLLTASPALRGSSAEGSIQQGRVGHQAGADTPTWPDPPSPAAAENIAWPAPPSPTDAGDIVWPAPATPIRNDKAEEPAVPIPDRNIRSDAESERQVGAELAISDSQMSLGGFLICCAVGLVVVGIFLRHCLKITLSRRLRKVLAQGVPRGRNVQSGRGADVVSDDQTRQTLRKLLQVLEQGAVRG